MYARALAVRTALVCDMGAFYRVGRDRTERKEFAGEERGGHASPSILESAHTFAFLILNFMYLFSFPEIGIM